MGTPRFTPEFKEEAVRQITERGCCSGLQNQDTEIACFHRSPYTQGGSPDTVFICIRKPEFYYLGTYCFAKSNGLTTFSRLVSKNLPTIAASVYAHPETRLCECTLPERHYVLGGSFAAPPHPVTINQTQSMHCTPSLGNHVHTPLSWSDSPSNVRPC